MASTKLQTENKQSALTQQEDHAGPKLLTRVF